MEDYQNDQAIEQPDGTLEDGFYYIYDPNTDTWEVNDKVF